MIRVSLERAAQGDCLAKPVFDMDGKMLLNSGVELNEEYLAQLREHGVSEIYVDLSHTDGVVAEDGVSDASRIEVLSCAHACAAAAREEEPVPTRRVVDAVEGISDDLRRSRGKTVAVSPARGDGDWWEVHARNVALVAVATAGALGMERREIAHLGVGALVHDIGRLAMPLAQAHAAASELSDAGRGHTVRGFQLLMTNPEMSASSAIMCLQHHERLDGSGFPKGLTGEHMNVAAQICAAADVLDLVIAPPPFGHGTMAHVALAQLRAQPHVASERVMAALARAVAPYPPGTMLRLTNGSRAVVREARAHNSVSLRLQIVSNNDNSSPLALEVADNLQAVIEEIL